MWIYITRCKTSLYPEWTLPMFRRYLTNNTSVNIFWFLERTVDRDIHHVLRRIDSVSQQFVLKCLNQSGINVFRTAPQLDHGCTNMISKFVCKEVVYCVDIGLDCFWAVNTFFFEFSNKFMFSCLTRPFHLSCGLSVISVYWTVLT